MSISWLNAAMEEPRTKNGARLMLFVLADRADDNGVSFYGVETLTKKTNLGLSAAHAALRELVKLGLLRVEYKKGPRGCNIYHLLLTLRNPHGADSALCGIQQGTLRNPHKDPAESGPNPSGIHQEPSISSSPRAAATKFSANVVEAIYQAYPRKKAPAEAKKAIAKHLSILAKRGTSNPAGWLLGQVQAFARTRVGEDEQFTPYPATWINAGRYDEDFSAPLQSHNGKTKPIGSMSSRIAAHRTFIP